MWRMELRKGECHICYIEYKQAGRLETQIRQPQSMHSDSALSERHNFRDSFHYSFCARK